MFLDKKSKSKQKPDGELGELVNPDGSLMGSSIPILNQRNLAKKTTDQTVRMTKANQFPFIRVYYGESEESEETISEVDQSESFGFEETEYAPTYDVANKIMKNRLWEGARIFFFKVSICGNCKNSANFI